MPVRRRSARAFLNSLASNDDGSLDNRLALVDQALFAGHHAAGIKEVMQVVWVYEHPIDWSGLKRFHHNLGHGLLGRRIERSPLPFARHRWVADRQPSEINIAELARPRTELSEWADDAQNNLLIPKGVPAGISASFHLRTAPSRSAS